MDTAVIVDVEPSGPIRTAETFAARRWIDRIADRFGVRRDKLVGDTGYGSAEMLGWMVKERGIAPHIPVRGKPKRTDGTFSREECVSAPAAHSDTRPGDKPLQTYRGNVCKPRRPNGGKDGFIRYRASQHDCDVCPFEPKCALGDPGRRRLAIVVAMTVKKIVDFLLRWRFACEDFDVAGS